MLGPPKTIVIRTPGVHQAALQDPEAMFVLLYRRSPRPARKRKLKSGEHGSAVRSASATLDTKACAYAVVSLVSPC